MRSSLPLSIAATLFVVAGCIAEPALERETARMVEANGRELNGRVFNGRVFNGRVFNGRVFNGEALQGLRVEQGGLVAEANGLPVEGADLAGATLDGTDGEGAPIRLEIVAVSDAGLFDDALAGVYFYDVLLGDPATGLNEPACEGGAQVIALAGHWDESGAHVQDDPEDFTLACRGFVLAKCVEFGYVPFREHGGVPLADHHQACTRMLRADYCGDGTAMTLDGTPINIWDDLVPQIESRDPTFGGGFEAEWAPDGARCVSALRYAQLRCEPQATDLCYESPLQYVLENCPWRISGGRALNIGGSGACGPDFSPATPPATLLMNESEQITVDALASPLSEG